MKNRRATLSRISKHNTRLTSKAILAVAVLLVTAVSHAQTRTVVYEYPWGKDVVTYNSARVSIQDLNRWMKVSPTLSHYNYMLVPEDIFLCSPLIDRRYHNCGHGRETLDKHNAQVTFSRMSARMQELRRDRYPSPLLPVIHYFTHIQSFALARGKSEFEFLDKGDIRNLEERLDFVDPAASCRIEINNIRKSADRRERATLVEHDWFNCVWFAELAKIGPYPQAAWDSFLTSYGISEEVTEEGPD